MTPQSSPTPIPAAAFPTTCWSRVLGGGRRPDLEELARLYWHPVYAAIRARGADHHDAHDLTQEFFVWLMERGVLARAERSRGRFRAFLKTVLQRFLIGRHRRAHARGRGLASPAVDAAPSAEPSPDEVLDAAWRAALVQQAFDGLQRELEAAGRGRHFAVFREFFTAVEAPDYRALAARHEISTAQVSNALQYCKRRYRALLRAAVLDTVTDEESLRAELRWLFGPQEAER